MVGRIVGQNPVLGMSSYFRYGNSKRSTVTSQTTFDAILAGERTATTRFPMWYDRNQQALEQIKALSPGDIVEFWDTRSRTPQSRVVQVVVQPTKLSQEQMALASQGMPLRKLISGGQTGADRGGLDAAQLLGIPTGGMAPQGYRTEAGADYSLQELGLTESSHSRYDYRTEQNLLGSDGTVLFGKPDSAGSKLTLNLADKYHKPIIVNPDPVELNQWLRDKRVQVLNVAGNRESVNPGIHDRVVEILTQAGKGYPELQGLNGATYALSMQRLQSDPRFLERWSQLEGWTPEAGLGFFAKEPLGHGYQFQYRLI